VQYLFIRMSRYILNEVETSHDLILIRLYFILTILITEDDHNHIFFNNCNSAVFFRNLNQKQLGILSKFHIDNLRKFQSLPIRTATAVIYLLIRAMPIEAEIHKRQISFLHNILNYNNDNIRALTDRQYK
jgi:hypothetical protein